MAKKRGCKQNQIKIGSACHSRSKKIRNLDSELVHELFRKYQKIYGVKSGDVGFDFLMPLEAKVEREGGISLGALDNKVSRYYKTIYGGKHG